ncbi:MAG: chorismate synthase [Eubacterium sp.]|nr:chorismate synthase [Eubacterium sp.]
MNGSSFGSIFQVSTWGESHGKALGVVVDGCPAGINLTEKDFESAMARRRPGQTKYVTPRAEQDQVEILSGVFEGRTTGTPISLVIRNTSQKSGDYSEIAHIYRPGHADYTFDAKYGFRDYRGGGRSSGRETASRVAAGVVAGKFLEELGIATTAYVKQIGPCECVNGVYSKDGTVSDEAEEKTRTGFVPSREMIEKSPLRMPDPDASARAEEYLSELMKQGDSAGGIIECIVTGVPAGVGDPVFGKLDALLGHALFSIGAVKGVEIGAGFSVAGMNGSTDNDAFSSSGIKLTNNSGGILGGISDGDDIVIRAAFKPTPSISKPQQTVTDKGEEITIEVRGRHDPVIVPRAVVVVESMVNLVLTDRLLVGMSAQMDRIKAFYKN